MISEQREFSVYPPRYTLPNFWACTHASYTLACFFQRVVQRVRFRRVTEGGSVGPNFDTSYLSNFLKIKFWTLDPLPLQTKEEVHKKQNILL